MIVKDEQDMLEECLLSVKDLVNEIIIVDTGSSDDTVAIAEDQGARVFSYPWNGSFSRARNFSMEQAGYEWILLLDADERVVEEDKGKLLDFIQTTDLDGAHFKVYNFVGRDDSRQYTLHNALRLVRNNKMYHFRGDIHEQITSVDGRSLPGRFAITEIRIHHLGYLDSVVAKKEKRSRNIPLLLEELARKPQDPFTLFNLGNEYMAKKDYHKALEFFGQARLYYKHYEAYAPHLLFRSAMCCYSLGKYSDAIKTLVQGLSIFPGCTDMEFLKGLIYMDWHRDMLAVESFEKAMAMGEPHPTLQFSEGCATIRPMLSMALVYERQHHYSKAADCYIKALGMDSRLYNVLYNAARVWKHMMMEADDIEANLVRFFKNLDHIPNRILLIDILISQGLLTVSKRHLEALEKADGYELEKAALLGKYLFHRREYEQAGRLLKKALDSESYPRVLVNAGKDCALIYFAQIIICGSDADEDTCRALGYLTREYGPAGGALGNQILHILQGKEENLLAGGEPRELLDLFSQLLGLILDKEEFELFEKLLYAYNYIDSPRVLLALAAVYLGSGFQDMAAAAVLRSIKELDTIDADGAYLLANALQNAPG